MISCDKMGRGLVRREEVYSPRSGVGSSEPVPSVSSEQSRKSASFASCEPAGFTVSDGSVMSTTQESIAEECLKSVVSAASHESRRSASESEIPDLWKAMSTQIRSAVSKSMPSTQLVNRTPNYHLNDDKDAMGVEAAPTEYMIEITDELREITEVKMERGDLTHNRETVSMDALLQHVVMYNRKHPHSPLNIAPALQRSCIVAKSQKVPELITEKLKPIEKLRLSSLERTYQNMLTNSIPIFKKLQKANDQGDQVPDTLMIEMKTSLAMGVSLLLGLFVSFSVGWFGGPYIGIHLPAARAILGLILSIICMVTEVSLIILRASKLERIRAMRNRRHQRLVEQARLKLQKSPTPSTEATVMNDPPGGTSGGEGEDLLKED